MSLLSVIVPVYNRENYLKECLDSLVNQTYQNLEIICVNDGSTDNSLNILNEYAQKYKQIKVISKPNEGQGSARNTGIKTATGKYLTFVDSDDFLELNTYEYAMKHIDKADLVCFGIKVFGDTNYEARKDDDEYYKIKFNGLKKLNNKIVLKTDVSACNKIFNKEILEKHSLEFPEGFYYEDAEFYYKYISCISTAYYINKYYYNYRRTDSSIMADTFSGSDKAIHHLYIMKHIYEFWIKNNYLTGHKSLFEKLFLYCFNFAYWHSKVKQRAKVLHTASEYASIFDEKLNSKSNFIKNLKKKKYNELYEPDLPFYKKIFKVKKVFCLISKCHRKNLYILGLRFKIKNKNEELICKLNQIEEELNELRQLYTTIKNES